MWLGRDERAFQRVPLRARHAHRGEKKGIASMQKTILLAALGATALLTGCVAPREQAPPPVRRPIAPPPPPPAPPPASKDWRDVPITPGNWRYSAESGGTTARFGQPGAPQFSIRCDSGTRRVVLARTGAAPGAAATMDITTSAGRQVLRGQGQDDAAATTSLPASDPLLDRMAFSRGRFIVSVPGTALLAIPAWPEFARVVEDCRG
jgi:hypothetical protein